MKASKRVFTVAIVFLWGANIYADDITWTNSAGGVFHDEMNWEPNTVPTADDVAIFNLEGDAYTVTLTENITNFSKHVRAGTVTFDLGGCTYFVYRNNSMGTPTETTIVTYTNGNVTQLDGQKGDYFTLQGTGSTLFARSGVYVKNLLYGVKMDATTSVVIDGPGAKLNFSGYARVWQGSIIVTNGGNFIASDGLIAGSDPGFIHVSGAGSSAYFTWKSNIMHEDTIVQIENGASVRHGTYGTKNTASPLDCTVTLLDDASWFDLYEDLERGWRSINAKGVLQGTGSVSMQRIIMNGGTIRPGCSDEIGVLTFTGIITNEVSTSVFDMELGEPTPDAYDRIRLIADKSREPGTFYASGSLNVTAINNYKPIKPTTFQLIEAEGGIVPDPAFDTLNLPWQGTWDTTALYTSGEISFNPNPMGTTIIIR